MDVTTIFSKIAKQNIRKILACQQRQLGDVLVSTPVFECLHKAFPQAEVHVFTEKKCVTLLENNPAIHTVWGMDKQATQGLLKSWAWYKQVAKEKFDLVVDLQQLPRCRAITYFSKAPIRLSYTPAWYNRCIYTHWVDMHGGYASEQRVSILKPLGIEWTGELPKLYLTAEETTDARTFLVQHGVTENSLFLTIDATHKHPSHCWPAEYYAQLIDLIAQQYPAVKMLLLFGLGEEAEIAHLLAQVQRKDVIIQHSEQFSLRQSAACISLAHMHIGNCSAPRHMAVAVNTPSLVFLGASGTVWTPSASLVSSSLSSADSPFSAQHKQLLPPDLHCHPCSGHICSLGHYNCLRQISPQYALNSFSDFLHNIYTSRFFT